jgi:hypothetical protein
MQPNCCGQVNWHSPGDRPASKTRLAITTMGGNLSAITLRLANKKAADWPRLGNRKRLL